MRGSEREEHAVGRVAVLVQQFKERGKVGREDQLRMPDSKTPIIAYSAGVASKHPSPLRGHAVRICRAAQVGCPGLFGPSQNPQCGGAFKIIAAIEEPALIVRILTHLGLPARAPPRPVARPAFAHGGQSASKPASMGRHRDRQTRASGEFSSDNARFTASRTGDSVAREEKGGLNFLYLGASAEGRAALKFSFSITSP